MLLFQRQAPRTIESLDSVFREIQSYRIVYIPVIAPFLIRDISFPPHQYQCFKSLQAEPNDGGKFRSGVWTNSDEAAGRNCCCHHGFEVSEHCRGNLNWKSWEGKTWHPPHHTLREFLFLVYHHVMCNYPLRFSFLFSLEKWFYYHYDKLGLGKFPLSSCLLRVLCKSEAHLVCYLTGLRKKHLIQLQMNTSYVITDSPDFFAALIPMLWFLTQIPFL